MATPGKPGSPATEHPAGARTFRCAGCDFPITLLEGDDQPTCPRCGSGRFERSSIFSGETASLAAPALERAPAWLVDVRESVAHSGPHLAWESDEGNVEVVALSEEFTHIGRSLRADIRVLDPTVSRRHAVIHRHGDTTTVLDDHSLNGVYVDGEKVDWRPLEDGNEIELGSYRFYFISGTPKRASTA